MVAPKPLGSMGEAVVGQVLSPLTGEVVIALNPLGSTGEVVGG